MLLLLGLCGHTMETHAQAPAPIPIAEQLLRATKTADSSAIRRHRQALATLSVNDLSSALTTQNHRLSFWLNCYNAFAQLLIAETPLKNGKVDTRIFRKNRFRIAGKKMSLDDIEHGMLRRSQWKFGLGYIQKWLPGQFEKRLRVDSLDNRIHFAMNCGASSCPVIGFYTPESVDEALDIATESYLKRHVTYDSTTNTASVPKVFQWFRGDFGGKPAIYQLLKRYELIPPDCEPTLDYKDWDWTRHLGAFVEESKSD